MGTWGLWKYHTLGTQIFVNMGSWDPHTLGTQAPGNLRLWEHNILRKKITGSLGPGNVETFSLSFEFVAFYRKVLCVVHGSVRLLADWMCLWWEDKERMNCWPCKWIKRVYEVMVLYQPFQCNDGEIKVFNLVCSHSVILSCAEYTKRVQICA